MTPNGTPKNKIFCGKIMQKLKPNEYYCRGKNILLTSSFESDDMQLTHASDKKNNVMIFIWSVCLLCCLI